MEILKVGMAERVTASKWKLTISAVEEQLLVLILALFAMMGIMQTTRQTHLNVDLVEVMQERKLKRTVMMGTWKMEMDVARREEQKKIGYVLEEMIIMKIFV